MSVRKTKGAFGRPPRRPSAHDEDEKRSALGNLKNLPELCTSLPQERPFASASQALGGFLVQSGWDLRSGIPDSGYTLRSEKHNPPPGLGVDTPAGRYRLPAAWTMELTAIQLLDAVLIGLVAGVLGGLAGIGGSMIMLPGLHLVFGEKSDSTHHLYMAAAMTVNVAVAFPAAIRHYRRGAVRKELLPALLVTTTIFMVVGVLTVLRGDVLRVSLAAFLCVYCAFNIWRLLVNRPVDSAGERTTRPRLLVSGGMTGFVGGVLGLGGGVMLVPALQMLCRVRLKQAIATSSAVICLTALLGAGLKMATLSTLGEPWQDAALLAVAMAPTAMIGGAIGANLTHYLPTAVVRAVVSVLLLVAAARLAGLLG